MNLIIGGPVYDRAWLLPLWFERIVKQDYPLEDIGFVFNVDPKDTDTIHCLEEFHHTYPQINSFDILYNKEPFHSSHQEGQRVWTKEKYHFMAQLRNEVLDKVCELNPQRFFSLDSDVLLENNRTISELVQITSLGTGIDAVSPLMFMMPENIVFPNSMSWMNNKPGSKGYRHARYPFGSLFMSDIIMAAVMMTRAVFQKTRYQWHEQGEDLGWAAQCADKGFSLYNASYIYTPHIMSKMQLEKYLREGDDRGRVRLQVSLNNND